MMLLVLDVGTTGTRAVLIDTLGHIHGMAYQEYKSQFHGDGAVDQDPWTWWQAVLFVVPQVIASTRVSPANIQAIAVTSQRATILPVDASGQPLAPAILWQDKRTLKECRHIAQVIGEEAIYRTTGLRIDPYFSLPKVLWFQREESSVFQSAYTFLTVHDWIVFQLTGAFATELTQASRTQLFDVRNQTWARELARTAGLTRIPFPEVHPTGSILHGLSKTAADKLGLTAGTPVVLAGGDQQCAAVGLQVIRENRVKVTTGTGSFIVSPVARPILDPKRRVLCSLSAVPGQWILEAGIFTTGAILRWWRDEMAEWAVTEAACHHESPYEVITRCAAMAPPGSHGALLIPHFAGSAAPYWNAEATGILFGLSQRQSKADLARAVLEGIVLETNKNLAIMLDSLNTAPAHGADPETLTDNHLNAGQRTIHVTGGLTRSNLFNQIQADVYGRPVTPAKTEQATAVGAAVLAAVAIGAHVDLDAATASMCHMDEQRTMYPDKGRHRFYQHLQKLHHNIYDALETSGVYEFAGNVPSQQFS